MKWYRTKDPAAELVRDDEQGLLTFKSEYEADMAAMARATVQVCRQIERAAQLLQRARMFLEGGSIENRHERQHELCNEITAYLADEGDQ